MKNLMIATPAYSGTVTIPYTLSFTETVCALQSNGVAVTPHITASGSLLVAERNRIIQAFWESECTHLLCIDSDLGWPAQAVLAMLEQDKDFIAGCYPARGATNTFFFRPVQHADGRIVQEKHLLKMEYVPAGFLLLSRNAIAKMREAHPNLYYEPKAKPDENPPPGYCFFNTEVWDGEFWGEDFVFCRRAREAGLDIWVDPLIQFNHAGTIGMLIQSLTSNPAEAQLPTMSKAA